MQHSVKILDIADVTHNVRRYTLEKPAGCRFEPGQATDVSLDEEGWRDKKHPSPSPRSPMRPTSN